MKKVLQKNTYIWTRITVKVNVVMVTSLLKLVVTLYNVIFKRTSIKNSVLLLSPTILATVSIL